MLKLSALFSPLIKPITSLIDGWNERATVKLKGKLAVSQAKSSAKVARYLADAKRYELDAQRDQSYDERVLSNRERSLADEAIIAVFMSMFALHFVPVTQPYMLDGWIAMGYEGVPWWFEFVMVGICVSTLGLMRLLRLWFSIFKRGKANER